MSDLIALKSVGNFIDSESLITYPMPADMADGIDFHMGVHIDDIENPVFWERLSEEDKNCISDLIEYQNQ